jgi:hypothetical protein
MVALAIVQSYKSNQPARGTHLWAPGEMAAAAEADYDWIFDYLANALSSPSFTGPLDAFVEGEFSAGSWQATDSTKGAVTEKCIVFDNDEENKLVYTTIHEVSQARWGGAAA